MREARAFAYRERAAQAHDKAKRANISEETSFVQSLVKDAPPTAPQHTERSPTPADKRTAIHLPSGGPRQAFTVSQSPPRKLIKSAHNRK
jgi:hypothetical protein